MDMFLNRMIVAASDAMRNWTAALTDPCAARAWMLLNGVGGDVPAGAARDIGRAAHGIPEETRRRLLASAFWATYSPEFPVMAPARARLLAGDKNVLDAVREPASVNATQLVDYSTLEFPLKATQQSKIEGAHVGFFDDITCVWPWDGIDTEHLLDAVLPTSLLTLVEPGPAHNGWTGWAGYKSYQFLEALQKSVEGRFKIVLISNSKPGNVMSAVFGIEAV
jgi:hypothetical protein